MKSVVEHYENHLAEYYNWLWGGMEQNVNKNIDFFSKFEIIPKMSGIAIDLGCGSGFQSIPLAKIGFNVFAVDISDKLLVVLNENANDLCITTINENILNIDKVSEKEAELIICMGDTLTHLASLEEVKILFEKVYNSLQTKGKFILTFRDLCFELKGLDRFIPVRSDENNIFTCFLEYNEQSVIVNDLIYTKSKNNWDLKKSSYRKIKINSDWVQNEFKTLGFNIDQYSKEQGLITAVLSK